MTTSASLIQASYYVRDGKKYPIITMEIEYPRIIHSEFMTHRLFSRNSASSRAIPVAKVNERVLADPAMPVRFGKNQAGMQDYGDGHVVLVKHPRKVHPVTKHPSMLSPDWAWRDAAEDAVLWSKAFADAGYHKQVCNRLTEPFQWMKVVVTATNWDNFFWLRCHKDADPTMKDLADKMLVVYNEALENAMELEAGEWHVPYVERKRDKDGKLCYYVEDKEVGVEVAKQVSTSCCAQVSYRLLDSSTDKASSIFSKFADAERVHASPFEHQASPIRESRWNDAWYGSLNTSSPFTWDVGITHMDKDGEFWSGNFKGWIQHRQLIPNHVCEDFEQSVNKEK